MTFQGFKQSQENWAKLPHEFIELLPLFSTMAELKIVIYVLRHTWGYNDPNKKITIDEFMNGRKRADDTRIDSGTGMSKTAVIDGINKALEHGFLCVTVDDSDKARIKKYYEIQMLPMATSGVADGYIGGSNVLQRTEKDTLDRNLRNINNGQDANAPDVANPPKVSLSCWYAVDHSRKMVSYQSYTRKEADASKEGWERHGFAAVAGKVISTDPQYRGYTRAPKPRTLLFDAFAIAAFDLPENYTSEELGGDASRIGKLIKALCGIERLTDAEARNNEQLSNDVKRFYTEWREKKPGVDLPVNEGFSNNWRKWRKGILFTEKPAALQRTGVQTSNINFKVVR